MKKNPFCALVQALSDYELIAQDTYQNPDRYIKFRLTPDGMRAYCRLEMEKIEQALQEEHARGLMAKSTIRQLLDLAQGSPIFSLYNGVQVQLQQAVKPLLGESEEFFESRRAGVACLFVQFYQGGWSVSDDLVNTFFQLIARLDDLTVDLVVGAVEEMGEAPDARAIQAHLEHSGVILPLCDVQAALLVLPIPS
jgi:hypothetical protein